MIGKWVKKYLENGDACFDPKFRKRNPYAAIHSSMNCTPKVGHEIKLSVQLLGCSLMPKGKRYTAELKQMVAEYMRKKGLSLQETKRKFEIGDHHIIARWERIYLEEGMQGLEIELNC